MPGVAVLATKRILISRASLFAGKFDEPMPRGQVVSKGAVQVKLALITLGQQQLWRIAPGAGGASQGSTLRIGVIKEVGALIDDLVSIKCDRR